MAETKKKTGTKVSTKKTSDEVVKTKIVKENTDGVKITELEKIISEQKEVIETLTKDKNEAVKTADSVVNSCNKKLLFTNIFSLVVSFIVGVISVLNLIPAMAYLFGGYNAHVASFWGINSFQILKFCGIDFLSVLTFGLAVIAVVSIVVFVFSVVRVIKAKKYIV